MVVGYAPTCGTRTKPTGEDAVCGVTGWEMATRGFCERDTIAPLPSTTERAYVSRASCKDMMSPCVHRADMTRAGL